MAEDAQDALLRKVRHSRRDFETHGHDAQHRASAALLPSASMPTAARGIAMVPRANSWSLDCTFQLLPTSRASFTSNQMNRLGVPADRNDGK